jgi:hypothetical protein
VNTCDFPLIFLENAISAKLSEYAPPVAQLMQRFFLDEKITLAIEGMMEKEKLGVVSAVCKWMKAPENVPIWEAWLPPRRFWVECELGEIVTEAGACAACPPGFHSKEPYATECVACKPGSPHCCDKVRWQLLRRSRRFAKSQDTSRRKRDGRTASAATFLETFTRNSLASEAACDALRTRRDTLAFLTDLRTLRVCAKKVPHERLATAKPALAESHGAAVREPLVQGITIRKGTRGRCASVGQAMQAHCRC